MLLLTCEVALLSRYGRTRSNPAQLEQDRRKDRRRLRAQHGKRCANKKPGNLAPEVIALQSALNEFPCAIKILLVECSKEQTSLHTVICHDLSHPRTTDAELLGVVRQEDLDLALLRGSLGIDLATIDDFRLSTFFDDNWMSGPPKTDTR